MQLKQLNMQNIIWTCFNHFSSFYQLFTRYRSTGNRLLRILKLFNTHSELKREEIFLRLMGENGVKLKQENKNSI